MKAPGPHLDPKTRQVNHKAAYYNLRIRRSRLHQYGIFAGEDIPRGRRVIEFTGRRISYAQAARMRPPDDVYLARKNSRWVLDGRFGGSGAEFINHSCDANLVAQRVRGRLLFFSNRMIRAGEELTADYNYPVKLRRVPCRCGAPQCRGTLRFILS